MNPADDIFCDYCEGPCRYGNPIDKDGMPKAEKEESTMNPFEDYGYTENFNEAEDFAEADLAKRLAEYIDHLGEAFYAATRAGMEPTLTAPMYYGESVCLAVIGLQLKALLRGAAVEELYA